MTIVPSRRPPADDLRVTVAVAGTGRIRSSDMAGGFGTVADVMSSSKFPSDVSDLHLWFAAAVAARDGRLDDADLILDDTDPAAVLERVQVGMMLGSLLWKRIVAPGSPATPTPAHTAALSGMVSLAGGLNAMFAQAHGRVCQHDKPWRPVLDLVSELLVTFALESDIDPEFWLAEACMVQTAAAAGLDV